MNQTLDLQNMPKVITDPATGLTQPVTEQMIQSLLISEEKIKIGMSEIALALKNIKDQKLYLILEIPTMEEYLSERWTKSRTQAYFYMKLADAYSSSPHYQEIASLPQKILNESFKDFNIVKQLKKGEYKDQEGNTYTFCEISKMGNQEFQKKFILEKNKNKELKNELERAKQDIQLNETTLKTYHELKDNNERFRQITSEKETLGTLLDVQGQIALISRKLNQIETTDNLEAVSLVSSIIGALAGLTDSLEDKWAVKLTQILASQNLQQSE